MKKFIAYTFLFLGHYFSVSACDLTKGIAKDITSSEATGLKEALKVGTEKAVKVLNVTDGYLGNALVKILLPPEAQQIRKYAKNIGLKDKIFEDAIVSMNRAAEKSAKEAKPIFVNAITSMTIKDATSILFSKKQDEATKYLRSKTYGGLQTLYQPKIKTSLESVGATAIWDNIVNPYNRFANTIVGKIAGASPVNPNLEEYVTKKALDGLFLMIAKEEKNIRENPAARVTDILKQVFGKLGK